MQEAVGSVVVTGATGFTGTHLVRTLLGHGHDVVAFTRRQSDTAALRSMGARCIPVKLHDLDSVTNGFRQVGKVDRVFSVAAAFRSQHADLAEFRRVNVEGARNVLEAGVAAGSRRLIHCSTVGVQGEIEEPPAKESYRTAPGDVYQSTKLEGERIAVGMAQDGAPVVVVRPVGIYGPGDTRFLKLFRSIARGRMVMIGSGETLYHLTYVTDLVNGMVLASEHDDARGEVFTLGGPRYTTLNELMARVAKAIGKSPPKLRVPYAPVYAASVVCDRVCRAIGVDPPLYPRRVEFFSKDRAFDISKARRMLGYEPEVDLDEGLARTAEWYRKQGLL